MQDLVKILETRILNFKLIEGEILPDFSSVTVGTGADIATSCGSNAIILHFPPFELYK